MTYRQPAPAGTTIAPGALDSQVGKEIPVNLPDGGSKPGRVVAAKVADDGQSVELTIEVDITLPPSGPYSFGLS